MLQGITRGPTASADEGAGPAYSLDRRYGLGAGPACGPNVQHGRGATPPSLAGPSR